MKAKNVEKCKKKDKVLDRKEKMQIATTVEFRKRSQLSDTVRYPYTYIPQQ